MTYETSTQLVEWVYDARQRTFDLVADLNDEQLIGPYLPIVNPPLWEIGHVAWFQEKWVLRHACKQKPIRDDTDGFWDSIAIAHDTRWALSIPSREETLAYMREVRDAVIETLEKSEPSEKLTYLVRYAVFHEDMHTEAFTYTRQTLEYPPPRLSGCLKSRSEDCMDSPLLGDVEIPGGTFLLGAKRDEGFVFDNEKWAHPVNVKPFAIGRVPVTQSEFAAFVGADGYLRKDLWSPEGWDWRESVAAEYPVYWQCDTDGGWVRRHFDNWAPLEPNLPVIHVNWHEAEAYCRWAGRRLPTEVEWEVAAAAESHPGGQGLSPVKRRFPWGDEPPTPAQANLDWNRMGCINVNALPDGDSAFGCRQMIGNVWEWTCSSFLPYPGFEIDLYKEYSEPWFGTRKVLRGGCWTTRSRMLRNTWRNFYTPDRRDVLAGFRTCALN
jgi:iron(II)-dependent oxidoreductase